MAEKKDLKAIHQSRPRPPLPRPAVFKDKKKYDRKSVKAAFRREAGEH